MLAKPHQAPVATPVLRAHGTASAASSSATGRGGSAAVRAPADPVLPQVVAAVKANLPRSASSTARSSSRAGIGCTSRTSSSASTAQSRVDLLPADPASFVAFDLWPRDDRCSRSRSATARHAAIGAGRSRAPVTSARSPRTRDGARFETSRGGLDGVVAKSAASSTAGPAADDQGQARAAADCVVAGSAGTRAGRSSVAAAGLYTTPATCSTSASRPRSRWLAGPSCRGVSPYRAECARRHPWQDWANAQSRRTAKPMPGRSAVERQEGPLGCRCAELVVEISRPLEGRRLRHTVSSSAGDRTVSRRAALRPLTSRSATTCRGAGG